MWRNEIGSDYFRTLRETPVRRESLACLYGESRLGNLVVYCEKILWHGNEFARFAFPEIITKEEHK